MKLPGWFVHICVFFLISKKFCGCKLGKYTKKNMSKNTLHTFLKLGVRRITDSFLESFSYQAKKHILYIKFLQHFGGYSDEQFSSYSILLVSFTRISIINQTKQQPPPPSTHIYFVITQEIQRQRLNFYISLKLHQALRLA